MATSVKAAGAGAHTAGTNQDWSNPGNITASDDARATAPLAGAPATALLTDFLRAYTFGFSIPAGATIDGFTLSVERSVTSTSGNPRDYVIGISVDGSAWNPPGDTTLYSANKATGTTWPTSDGAASYGGAADMWGLTSVSVDDVNSAEFSVYIQVQVDSGEGISTTARVDYVELTVHYTAAASGCPKQATAYGRMRRAG